VGRSLRIALYSPYFGSTIGGGEKYLALTARALHDAFPQHNVAIVSPVPVDQIRYERMLNLDLSGIRLVATNRRITHVHRFLNSLGPLRPLRNRVLGAQARRHTSGYDLFLAMVYAIPVRSKAKASVILCQFPYREPGSELADYELIICQSRYVRGWIHQYWGREALVVNPPIDVPVADIDWERKERMIVSVGRFFVGGHSKRQDLLVETFIRMCRAGLSGWELHLAGSVHDDAQHAGFFDQIQAAAGGYPIHLHPDADFGEVQELYSRAAIYWHAAGYGLGDDAMSAEHFGMTTVEAMAHGAVPVVYDRGGQREIVEHQATGFVWSSLEELERWTAALIADSDRRASMGSAARETSRRYARERFLSSMAEALTPVVSRLEGSG
jgi:glycosyltransferase involved in cell wall biosynthesis